MNSSDEEAVDSPQTYVEETGDDIQYTEKKTPEDFSFHFHALPFSWTFWGYPGESNSRA